MYVRLDTLIYGILATLGIISLVLFIMLLIKMYKFFSKLNNFFESNERNIKETLESLPKLANNALDFSVVLKNVGDTIVETSTTALETKGNVEEYMLMLKDIFSIVKQVFLK